jgi:TatA/E family protein of Tat protein translocase
MEIIDLNEALLIGAIILALIIGPKKLPELARSIGQSKKAYNNSMKETEDAKPDSEEDAEN